LLLLLLLSLCACAEVVERVVFGGFGALEAAGSPPLGLVATAAASVGVVVEVRRTTDEGKRAARGGARGESDIIMPR